MAPWVLRHGPTWHQKGLDHDFFANPIYFMLKFKKKSISVTLTPFETRNTTPKSVLCEL
jgi:hypothetical protein